MFRTQEEGQEQKILFQRGSVRSQNHNAEQELPATRRNYFSLLTTALPKHDKRGYPTRVAVRYADIMQLIRA